MIILYGMVLILYFLLFFLALRKKTSLAGIVYDFCIKRKIFRQQGAGEMLPVLHPEIRGKREREKNHLRRFYMNKLRLLLFLVFTGDVLAICLFVSGRMESVVMDGKYIKRNTYGVGSREAGLEARIESGQGTLRQDFVISVEEQRYEEVLVKQLAEQLAEALPDIISGANRSIREVRNDLNLVREVEGYPFQIVWESNDYSLVYSDGSIDNAQIGEAGETVDLTAVFIYDDFRKEYVFSVHIFPPDYSKEEFLKKEISELLLRQEEKDRHTDRMELPESIGGEKIIWSENVNDGSGYIFILLCTGAGMVYFLQGRKLNEEMDRRNRQMLLDYPQLISKLMLYLGAGMTIRNSFRKIASRYAVEKQEEGGFHYVYEEMLLICHELDSGISEMEAYERFGKRCRLPQYTKLSNILVQNLRKGSNSILNALRQEADNAFEERRNMARKLGEEAGTKLLLPMMLMLGIVMILILVPAYFSFSV